MFWALTKLMMFILFACVTSVGAQTTHVQAVNNTGTITIHVIGFESDKGVARIAMFQGDKGFPDDVLHAYWKGVYNIHNRKVKARVPDVQYGTYAVSVHHDANSNGKLNKLLRFIPKEGFSSSNNTRDVKQGPTYDQSSFEVNSDSTSITIEMKYLFGK